MSKSLNKAMLIGNLVRDPELRYTSGGTAVSNFSLATNNTYMKGDQKQESVEYHNIVAWGKLADICGQMLSKGSKVYVSGRIQKREFTDRNGNEKSLTEIVIDEMILLSSTQNRNIKQDAQQSLLPYEPTTEDVADDVPF
jgi:single-strand DNA-binding protein